MPNQHKSLPSDEAIKEYAEYYWDLGMTDISIVEELKAHYDVGIYGLSLVSFRRLRKKWGMSGVRQQKHTVESIAVSVQHIRGRFPTMGSRQMVVVLRQNYQMRVPESIIAAYLRMTEPEAVIARKGRRFVRRLFYAAGVNDIWAFDQHDKWKRFGLYLHLGVDPFAGELLWLRVWWTNRNPRLIASYYLTTARTKGGVALVTQSDPGTENYGIANCHTTIRHRLDPSLVDTLQHRWMREKTNIKPEILWSILRHTWTPGFENIMEYGVLNGFYDPTNTIEKLVFLWLAIPWLQAELDQFASRFNRSKRRHDKHKLTPQGIPELIANNPERYGAKDYKIITPPELLDDMERQWAPPDHDVFYLTPPNFDLIAKQVYIELGEPVVSSETFWAVFLDLLQAIHEIPEIPNLADVPQSEARVDAELARAAEDPEVALLAGLRPLRFGQEGAGNQEDIQPEYGGGLQNPPPRTETFGPAIGTVAGYDDADALRFDGIDSDPDSAGEADVDNDAPFFAPLTDLRED